jgi:hypothetical protein
MKISPTPEQRAEMAAFIDAKQPGLLDDLGIQRKSMWLCRTCQTPCSADDPFCGDACRSLT